MKLLFSKRKEIAEQYREWLKEKNEELREKEGYGRYYPECVESFLLWLQTTQKGIKVIELLKEK